MNFFVAISIFFILFTVVYALFAAAILYHLRQYTLSDHPAPRVFTALFLVLASLLWLLSLYFLFSIPR